MNRDTKSEADLSSKISRIAAILGVLTAISIPAIYIYAAISYEGDRILAKTEVAASRLSEVAYGNPKLWIYMTDRLEGVLASSISDKAHSFRVIDEKGVDVLGKENPSFHFSITRVASLYDGPSRIGSIEYSEDIGHVFWRSVLAALLGLVLGGAMYIVLKVLPMRALRTALADLRKANEKVNNINKNLEILVAKRTSKIEVQAGQLEQALVREKELNETQRQFVSMASHEFRTPLAIIDATAQRMKSRAVKNRLSPEDAVQRVEKIRTAVRRMTRLMESTLSAARMDVGKISVDIAPCDVAVVVRDVCSSQQELTQDHVITCDLTGLAGTIQADSGAIEQVLTNLLSNAVKYAPDAPKIEVRAHTEGDDVVISVRDNGLGIDEDDLANMFQRYFRARTSTGIAGTGIGLNLVKTLVEMHDGSVNVESQIGKGSIFTVRLPVAGPEQAKPAETKAA